ncbi:MAG: hypothetical protein IT437_11810 [Phycisphaerales bacterium]|nr:hypothetical protein [Phycisphaerales bacterium]
MKMEASIAFAALAVFAGVAVLGDGPCFTNSETIDPCAYCSEPADGCADIWGLGGSCPVAHDASSGLSEKVPTPAGCDVTRRVPDEGGQCWSLAQTTLSVTCMSAGGTSCGDQSGGD